MSDKNHSQLKQTLLITLVILLVLFVGAQTWYMVGMKKQLEAIHAQQSSAQSADAVATPKEKATMEAENTVDTDIDQQAPVQEKQKQSPPQKYNKRARPWPRYDAYNRPFDDRRWNPYEEIQRMQRDMDRMFNQSFNRFNNRPDFQHFFRQGITTPEMDIKEDDNQYTVIVDLPGADESDISVNLDRQRLTIKGEQGYEKQDKNAMGNIVFQERRSGRFQRSITLPEPVKQNEMKTKVDKGVLTIIIPKEKWPG